MRTSCGHVTNRTIAWVVVFLLLAHTTPAAITYMSIEPIPASDIVGDDDLAAIRNIGYANLERWSQRLLTECRVVDTVVNALSANAAINSVRLGSNTRVVVAAGGFEGRTNPSFVLTVQDSGTGAVTEADVDVLGNALGYVLNQGSTAHFSPDNPKAYAFPLDYALVTFLGTLSGEEAQAFFEHLGTIDEALFSGLFAGFTQIDRAGSTTNNSMLFLQPATSKHRFIAGLSAAVADEPRASYSPLKNNGAPTTARAGAAFPENDWLAFPNGDQYLANVGGSAQLQSELAAIRQQHRAAVESLLLAIEEGRVEEYLATQFTCPRGTGRSFFVLRSSFVVPAGTIGLVSVAAHLAISPAQYDARIRSLIPLYDELIAEVAHALGHAERPVRMVVDLGIGTGALARACLERAPGARVWGIDADPDMMAIARTRLGPRSRRVTMTTGSFLDVALPPCDAIVASYSLHHIRTSRTKLTFFRQCFRALRPGGVLINGDCAPASTTRGFARDLDVWFAHLGKTFGSRARGRRVYQSWADEDTYLPLAEEIRLLERAGFTVDVPWRRSPFAVIVGGRRAY